MILVLLLLLFLLRYYYFSPFLLLFLPVFHICGPSIFQFLWYAFSMFTYFFVFPNFYCHLSEPSLLYSYCSCLCSSSILEFICIQKSLKGDFSSFFSLFFLLLLCEYFLFFLLFVLSFSGALKVFKRTLLFIVYSYYLFVCCKCLYNNFIFVSFILCFKYSYRSASAVTC